MYLIITKLLVTIFSAIVFVSTAGSFFNKLYGENRPLLYISVFLALVSTYTAVNFIIDSVKNEILASISRGNLNTATGSGSPAGIIANRQPIIEQPKNEKLITSKKSDSDDNRTIDQTIEKNRKEITIGAPRKEDNSVKVEINRYEESLASPESWIEPVTKIEFIKIPGGCYNIEYKNKIPKYRYDNNCVDAFWISKYEITNYQYSLFLEQSKFKGNGYNVYYCGGGVAKPSNYTPEPDLPVTCVSGYDAEEFTKWLSEVNQSNYVFRLPKSSEWKYACFNEEKAIDPLIEASLHDYAWYAENASKVNAVGKKRPNNMGIYDMIGNATEIVMDSPTDWAHYGGSVYSSQIRKLRCYSYSSRGIGSRNQRADVTGFRVVRVE